MTGTGAATFSVTNYNNNYRFFIDEFTLSDKAASVVAPTVTTPTSADVATTSATLGGNVTANGGATVTERGVVYSLASQAGDPAIGGTGCTKVAAGSAGNGVFTVSVTGLSANSDYKFRAYAINSAGTSYSSVGTFSTPAPGADCWICLETSANGTYYVGDSLASGWWVNWQVNGDWDDGWMKTWVGWQTSGDGYTEYTADWYADGDGSNKKVHSDIGGYKFTVAQPHYIIAQGQRTAGGPAAADATPGTSWTDSSAWPPDGLNTGTAHFTVNAIPNPTPGTPTAPTGAAGGRQGLSWSKNAALHNVMIVRYAKDATPTAPTGGQAYSVNNTIGAGTVVYNGSGTGTTLTSGLTAGTEYDYWFYSVNGDYYSSGTKVTGTASKAPTFGTGSVTKTTTTGTKVSNSQTASGTPSTMTYSGSCTAGGATSGNGTTAGTFNVNSSSGDFNFTPAAAGTYTFSVSAANGVTPNGSYTISVTVKPVALTLTAAAGASPGTVSLTVSGAEAGATVNVRRYGTSAAASSDTTGTSGTQVTAANANGTFTDSGLDGCTTYYYKAWQSHNSQTSAATDTKEAKTALAAPDVDDSNTSAMVMDLRWTAVPGATSYKVEVATDEDFTDATPGGWTSAANITLSGSASPPSGWTTGGNTYTEANGLRLGKSGTTGSLTSPSPAASGLTGKRVKVTVNARYYNSDSTANLRVTVSGGPSWETGGTAWDFTMTDTVSPYVNYINVSDSQTAVTFEFATTINGKRAWIAGIDISTEGAGTPGSKVAEGTRTTAGTETGDGDWTVAGSSWQWTWDAEDAGLSEDTYYWRVTATGGTCSEEDEGDVELTAVTPELTVSPLSLSLGSTTYGTPGGAQSFSVSGSDLTAGVTVTPPAGVSVCLTSGGTYQTTPLTISQASATSGATVYVKLTGASVGSPSGNISVASTGAATVNVAVSGTVTAVAPTVGSPTSASVGTTGATLGGTVTANGGATLTEWGVVYSATSKNTTPTVGGTGCTNLTASGTPSLAAFTRAVSGLSPNTEYKWRAYARNSAGYGYTAVQTFTTLRPTLTVSPASVSDMAGVQYQDGTPANVSVSGANMMGNVTVAVTSGFEVSTDGGSSWGSEKSITVAGATLTATTVKVRIAAGSGTGAVTGTLTVSSSNAADVTVSLAGTVSGATTDTGSWLGNSYLVLNGDWYNGSGSDNTALPATLGYLTTLTLGAQVQTYGQNDGETYPAYMTYSIDSGAETTVALVWFRYNDENHNNYFGMGGEGGQHVQTATTLDLSGLSGGEHTLHVYFSQPTSVGSGTLYDGGSATAVNYSITFVVPAWSGPNTVYWREQAVDGHFVRQDGDGNHDPWWYQITSDVGFHNPNMTDYGPNRVIINNNNQRMMTNDVASTVESFSFIAGDGLTMAARTNWGTATLTVNSAITNTAAQLVFRVPVALGGNVKVYNTNATYFLGGLSGSGKTLTKTGAGTVYISSAATLGSLVVTTGHVQLNTGGSLSGNASVASSRSLRTNPSSGNTVNYGGVLSGAGYFLKTGAGTTTLSGDNTYSGKTSVTNGTLIAGHANALGTGPVYVGGSSAKLQIGVASVSVKSVNFSGANSALVTGRDKVLASTQSAIINKVTFDAGNYSGDDTQWAIVTSSSGTITLNGTLTVQNAPASGSCTLELSGDSKTLYVTYHKPPTAPTLTVATVAGNGGALSVTATPPAGAGVVVVRNESGTFGSPTGSTLPSVGATEWAGGTVVDVTGGTFTDSGLTGCKTYYYKAWSLKNGLWSTTGGTDDAATDTVAAPVLNTLASVTYQGFTASWNAVPGAATYRMDIVQGSTPTPVVSYDFDESSSGWTLTYSERASNALKIGSGSYAGSVESPNIVGAGGAATLSFTAWTWSGDGDCTLVVEVSGDGGSTWAELADSPLTISGESKPETPITMSISDLTSTSLVMFSTTAKKKRVYVDDIVITQGGSSPVAGWTDKDVGSIMTESSGVVSVAVTGLEELTTYSVTVRAEGATAACASADSNTESATTLENDTVTSVAIANYDAAGEAAGSNVADGAVAAGQTALVQGTKLTVASGSVNPVLTGVTFATTGTATGSDVGTLRVRVGTSSTYAGTETALGTATYTGAGTYTVSGSQSLTPGTTYYVWIEAVTAAGAAGGSTVKVGALTGSSFAITNGRKTGSTTAAGTQTIGNLTAFSASTGSAQGGKVDLTWTAGASGTATVRWSDVSLEAIPAPGTAWANESTGLTGGSYTVTGLTGCKTYYFKAWEVVGGVACGTVRTDSADASSPAAPTGLGHGTPTAHEATLSWTAGAGAASHVIDLWHYEGGSGGEVISGVGGTYTKITSAEELTEGNYLIVGAKTGGLEAMSNTLWGTPAIYSVEVSDNASATSLEITTDDAAIVWHLAYDSETTSWSLKNEAYNSNAGGYAASSGNANASTIKGTLDAAGRWTIEASDGNWELTNVDQSSRQLKYNSVNTRFACYTSGQAPLMLFKQGGGGGSSGTKMDDIIAGVVQPESLVVVTNGATSVGLGHLTDGTTYYWTVKALGYGGCAGGVSGQDSFKTAELLGVPTIATPLTAGVGQLSGTVTGKAGATLILKRYDTEDLAGTGTAWGLDGTVVSAGETTPGSGIWTFTDTGLDGCTTYWYKAWQWEVIDGDTATSGGSAVASAQTDLAAPTVSAVGAGTQLTVNWTAVPGAVSYKVQISDTPDTWTVTAGGEGDAVLTEDFSGFTADSGTEISDSAGELDDYTSTSGWTGYKVFCNSGSAKIGAGAAGNLTTPSISAMPHGGKVYFDLKKYSSDTGNLMVKMSTDGGSTWTTNKTFTPTADWQTGLQADIPEVATAFKLRFETTSKRAYLDNVRVVPLDEVEEGTGRGLIYESTTTDAPASRTKTGLTIGQLYYYRVVVTGSEDCETEAGGSETTADAPIIEVMPTHYNFGTVTKNTGEHTAEFVVRNAGNVPLKFSEVSLVQDGDAYSITSPTSGLTAALPAGQSRTYKVQFNPQNSGARLATLRFRNDAYNVTGEVPVEGSETYANTDIPLSGMCFDPATADPDVLWLSVLDELGDENTVWDHNMAHSESQPVLAVIAYHYNGMAWDPSHPTWAQWSLYDEEGNVVLANQAFSAMTTVAYDGRSCSRFTAPIPALTAAKTYRGKYTVGVTLKDATRTYTTTTREVVPIEQEWLLDDFMRADAVGSGGGALGNSWVARASSGSLPGSAAIRGAALELYGPGGLRSGTAGRVAAGRDMSDERYPTTWSEFTGSGSWGFHFKTGAKTVSWADGSTAGAFVLGATHVAWFTSENAQKGVAVMFTNDCVRLVRFEKSLLAGGTITDLTTASYNGTQGKWLAVRVDYIPGQPEVDADESDDGQHHDAVPAKMRLYVKQVAGPGGNPVEECTAADLVETADVGDTVSGNLKFGGAVWNHGTAQLSETTGGTFDDLYVPHMDGEGEPMEFHVIDEDVEGPEFYGFSIRGAIAAPTAASSGMTVTGMVHDVSGLSGTVGFKMYNGDTLLASGSATPGAVAGSSTEFTVSFTIAAGVIDGSIRSSNCRFEVTATDGDDDRSEGGANIDAMEGTASYPFTFCASTPTAPGWATAEIDGAEMVVLRWERSAGTEYVVVRSDTEIGDNSSPQGRSGSESMAEGTTVDGWGKVVYRGTGDNHLKGTWTAREFIVDPGSTNYFAVYGMTGDDSTGYYFSAPTKPNAYAWATTNAATGEVTHETATSSGVPVSSLVAEGAWPCVTPKYEPGEGVDSFAYRTSVSYPESELSGDDTPARLALEFNSEYASPRPKTGSGWGNDAWTGDVGTWKVHDGNLETWKTHFPTPAGNKLYWEDTSSSSEASATLYRPLAAENTSGKFFVAGMMNYGGGLNASMFDTAGTWMSIALVDDNGDVLVSFGKQGGGTLKDATMQVPVGQFGVTGTDPVECRNNSGEGEEAYYTLNPGHGQDYIVAGEVDRENQMLRMWVFYAGRTAEGETDVQIPQVYDDPDNKIADPTALETVQASWEWADPSWAGKIAGIKLIAGSDGSHQLGHVYFDEIRFAQSWPELFLFNDPEVYTFDFDKPLDATGSMVGTDAEGHRLWEVSDGALAHGDVGLNAQFGLYHRTGISSANFTIKDADGNAILKSVGTSDNPSTPRDERLALDSDETGHVALSGRTGAAYSDWKTTSAPNVPGGAMGVAIPTNRISLDATYTVEVTLTSAGGREATVTAASESGGGGATDLFLGEFGEGAGDGEKYVEIYNGTGHDIDLSEYYIARSNPKGSSVYGDDKYANTWTNDYYNAKWYKWEKISATTKMMPHKTTVVLLSNLAAAELKAALEAQCEVIQMTTDVVNSGGKSVIALFKADVLENADENGDWANCPTNKPWLDACGLSLADAHFIQSRLEDTKLLPRPAPDELDPNEWDYRPWRDSADDTGYTNILATAGVYDRNIGLGGNMEFKVFDDDTDAPVMSEGGIKVGSGERLQGTPGDRTYVMGGWSFTNWPSRDGAATNNLTLEEYKWITEMWPYGMTTRGGVSWSPLLGGDDLSGYVSVIEAGNNKGESNAEFDGITQRKYGCMVARASGSYDKADEVWLGFDLDTSKLSEAVLSFGYAGGSAGFANARVEVSTTGQEGTFTHPTGWEFDPKTSTQNATTWAEWSGALADAGEAVTAAGHLWFRVVLKDYAKASGTFRLDNIRLEGAPEFLRVSDQDMNTQTVALGAIVSDANSGLDAGTATFTCGLAESELTADTPTLVSGGKGDSTFSWRKTGGFSKAKVQEWYEKSQEGKTQLRMSIADKDDDRPGDATTMSADFGTLDVYDDDDDPPTLEMATMKPRKEGTMAKWLLKEKTRTPSETMDGLDVGDLGLDTTAGTTSNPRYSLATNNSIKAYAVYQSGWQAGSKYWTATIKNTTAGAGTITRVKFWSKVGSVLAPTGYDIQSGTVAAGETEAETTTSKGTGSLLTSGPWVKEGAEGVAGSPIKEWAEYSKDVTIPIAAGETLELRIFGTGADADGIGATWYLWGLEFEGSLAVPGEGGEDGYTYVTDNSLAGGGTTLTMSGNVWDESGLAAVPTYSLTNAATGTEISSGTVSFTSAGTPASRTTKPLGEFSQNIALSSMGYGVQLAEYKGGIHAEDADYDREDGSGNNTDKSVLDGQFAFTVIDQDLVGPTAPTGVKVNGVDVPNSTPNRNNVAWTNQPEFTVSFNVANDIVPTERELTSADEEPTAWRAAHGITNGMVKKASSQKGAAGVGEYRVALPGAGGALPTAAAMSNAPAYSVAVTNGALANYGFERYLDSPGVPDKSWENPDGDSGINKGDRIKIGVDEEGHNIMIYPVAEGTNSYYLRGNGNGASMSQVIPFEASAGDQTVTVDLKLKIYKRSGSSIAYAKFEFSADGKTWRSAASEVQLNTGADAEKTWLDKEMATKALTANAGEKYLKFSLRMNGYTANIDDVRLSVRVGSAPAAGTADRATMRYLATVAGQGLDVKYLFAVDADNDRPQDRRLGDTAVFYTAYDVTPPTKVDIAAEHGTSVSTDTVEDPTSQFDVMWSTTGVGPDDPKHEYYQEGWSGNNVLSPWRSYRFYYKPWNPAEEGGSNPAGYLDDLVVEASATGWEGWKYAEHGMAIEDPSETAKGHVAYDGTTDKLNELVTTKARIYDLENDQDYVVAVVGVDAAGNVGEATPRSWATNNTIKFALTKGWRIQKSDERIPSEWKSGDGSAWKYGATNEASALEWIAAGVKYDENGVNTNNITKEYDLLYWDSDRFEERTSNPWTLSGSVKSNWFVDVAPILPRNTLRFYRASYKDRWKAAVTNTETGAVTAQTPLASEDVYSMATVTLTEGYNYVSLQGTPYTNSFAAVFGTDEAMWPCGGSADASTQVQFYTPRDHGFGEKYYLGKSGNASPRWYRVGTDPLEDVTDDIQTNGFFTRAFAIVLPDTLPDRYRETTVTVGKYQPRVLNAMHWHPIMHVPTNSVVVENGSTKAAFETTVECDSANSTEMYNPVALNLPTLATPTMLGITTVPPSGAAVGFRRGKSHGDRLYILDSETKEVRLGSTIYCDDSGVWRWVNGDGEVGPVIRPNDMMVIITRGGASSKWTWEYSPTDFYTAPTRHMGYGQ